MQAGHDDEQGQFDQIFAAAFDGPVLRRKGQFCLHDIHTGHYANLEDRVSKIKELTNIKNAVNFAHKAGLIVNAGHGLHYKNVQEIVAIKDIEELNIGHSIVSEALFVGWKKAIKDMKKIITGSTLK